MKTPIFRIYAIAGLTATLLSLAVPARAQYRPRPLNDPATGETYHIEAGADFWFPTADIAVASAGSGALSGLAGSQIDAKRDLGLTDQRFRALQLQLRPAKRHKFRFQYIPVVYTQSAALAQRVVFNGIAYNVGVPVNSSLDWKTYQVGYEYDFVSRNRGFAGLILEAKVTDVNVSLASPLNAEYAHARAPLPAIGGIARFYVIPNISITGEVTGFTVPSSVSAEYNAHYADIDVYSTINLTNNVGVKAGYRSLDVGYVVKADTGSFVLRGLYVGAVLRY